MLQLLPVRSVRLRNCNNLYKDIEVKDFEQIAQEDGEQAVVSDSNTTNRLHQNSGDGLRGGGNFHWESQKLDWGKRTEALQGIQFASFDVINEAGLHRASDDGSNFDTIFLTCEV